VLNHYGPTEATVGCCTFSVRENDVTAWAPATLPIGKPISNAQIYIVEPSLRPAPVGVAGELCIGGAGLAAGYLNQPGQTAERFIRNPFSADPEARIYRTGDLARYLPDGNIEFLGRLDHQVKIRGFRVEPAEIEAVLKSHAQVHQALVIPVEDKSGDKRLVAYVVPSGGKAAIPAEDLRDLTQQRLPDYMVPSAFVLLDALPLTPNGKVDRRALPSPDQAQGEAAGDFESPCNAMEEGVAAVWTEVLSRPRIGRHDNFFDLGGHSLLATQVISRLCSRFQVQLPLRTLFETPTVAGMAGIIAQSQPEQTEEVASLLNELEQLSDEEAEQLLAAEMEKSGKGEPQG
jgi:acyl carrier protein